MGYFGTLEHTKVLGVGAGAAGTHGLPRAAARPPARGGRSHTPAARAHTPPVQHTAQRANDNEVMTRLPALLSPLP